jgi:Helix-turn-helix domain
MFDPSPIRTAWCANISRKNGHPKQVTVVNTHLEVALRDHTVSKAAAIACACLANWNATPLRPAMFSHGVIVMRDSPERKAYCPRALTRKAPRLAGQISLLPEIDRPVSRLHEFGGGHIPPAVALEIEHLRNRHGLSQRELAARIGVSQGQYAHARRGHDPLSAFAVNRLRETLGANTDTNTGDS